MLLHWSRFFIADDGIQVAFNHLSDLYSSELLQQLAHQVSEQYRLLSRHLSEQEEVMIRTAADMARPEITFLNPASAFDRSRTDMLIARITNLPALCRAATVSSVH
ncbi:hypothetical protein [Spirosoma sp. KNUC1025]|uniref:hypothetical protein n=1 Tax=Spirosoma sp. KNUC1025 TaxID=2894082 RepID=UPI0038703751|nr:hypothetical protein LN737_20740 [Spirosoma sp. KNUC1025]